jgi:spore maturation protein CgeB
MGESSTILYVGMLWEGSTCLERMRILESLGCRVVPFDTMPWITAGGRWQRSFTSRFHWGFPVGDLNAALATFSRRQSNLTHVWIDKGQWIFADTLREIQQHTSAILVHYTPDAQLVLNQSRHFRSCLPLYDVVATTKPFEVELYRSEGAKRVILVLQGYDDRCTPVMPTSEDRVSLGSDTCFIGHYEHHYALRLRAARSVAAQLRVWGPRWKRYRWIRPWAWRHVAGDGIWGRHYALALASTKVALGLLSKRLPETTTTRTFEIPAMGVFMLAERTADHLALFSEGHEAEFFESDDELCDKLRFYLDHDSSRLRIAAAGRERCLRSGYHARTQLRRVLQQAA